MSNGYYEEGRVLEYFDTCDILVVGGGAAGHSAAIAAARAGAKDIVLLERYGYMGGDVTGGYVIMVPNLTWRDKSFVRGLQEEWFTRLSKIPGAVLGPEEGEYGSEDPLLIDRWTTIFDCVSRCPDSPVRVVRAVYYEPNQLKIEMDKMLEEEGDSIRVYYHCWATSPIMDGDEVKGVVFESKEGRKAIKAKVVIDATGDGDIYYQAGAPCSSVERAGTRASTGAGLSCSRWIITALERWMRGNPKLFGAMMSNLSKITGFRIMPCRPTPTTWSGSTTGLEVKAVFP